MTATANKPYVILDPTSGPLRGKDSRPMARRRVTLDGVVLGLLSNGKSNSQELLDAVFAELAKSFELLQSLRFRKDSVSVPPRKEHFAQLTREAGAVVTAIGD
ncbi:MAG: hypothetical protein HY261_00510 [Chloroflexi bacterium]|nr:hypothetical protein [Chloroflexota bacterium]